MMRIPHLLATAVAFASLSAVTSTAAQASGSYPVTVHKHVNFSGQSLGVGEGEVTISDLRSSVGNDAISSISIEAGYQVVACQNSRLRGRCDTFTSDVSDLRTISFNDTISSLSVTRVSVAPVTVFQHVNFGGSSLGLGEGDTTIGALRNSRVGNDRISSIQIADGYEVFACQHSRFRGRCETFTASTADLRIISFNDVISSLRVQKTTGTPPPPVNTAPVASDVFLSTDADTPFDFSLALDVTDADGDALSITVDTLTGLTNNNNGTFTFDPTLVAGTDVLMVGEFIDVKVKYEVSDEQATATATITISIEGTVPQPDVFAIGDIGPGGGTVFSVTNGGLSGLEYAPDVLTSLSGRIKGTNRGGNITWGCTEENLAIDNVFGFSDAGVPNQSTQSGAVNAGILDSAFNDGTCTPFAGLEASLYAFINPHTDDVVEDWYLPSAPELLELRTQFLGNGLTNDQQDAIDGFTFWSSTESSAQNAWIMLSLPNTLAAGDSVSPEAKGGGIGRAVLPVRSF